MNKAFLRQVCDLVQKQETPSSVQIKQFRKDTQMKASECAALLGVQVRAWYRYESGESTMKKEYWFYLQLLCNQLPSIKPILIQPANRVNEND